MSLTSFLTALHDSGHVRVAEVASATAEEIAGAVSLLQEFDRAARREAAGEPPAYSSETALWAATLFYRACQLLVFRDSGEAAVKAALGGPSPDASDPGAIWSADLTLRWIPDLVALARGISPGDPFVEGLVGLARRWPLSGVGVREAADADPAALVAHPALLSLYVDRIFERRESGRLRHPAVRAAAAAALGAYPAICPEVAAALREEIPT